MNSDMKNIYGKMLSKVQYAGRKDDARRICKAIIRIRKRYVK